MSLSEAHQVTDRATRGDLVVLQCASPEAAQQLARELSALGALVEVRR
jgi:ribosomal protein L7/L12